MTAMLALQEAAVARLRGHAPLVALLGGAKIFDDVPQGTAAPYVTVAIESRDWSSQTSRGHEHRVSLAAWSRERGRRQALEILGACETALATPMVLDGHALVGMQVVSTAAERAGEFYRGVLRLRAVTEELT